MILTGLAIYSIKPVTTRQTITNESEEVICVPTDQVNFKSIEDRESDVMNVKVVVDDAELKDSSTIEVSEENSASVNYDSKCNGEVTVDKTVVS